MDCPGLHGNYQKQISSFPTQHALSRTVAVFLFKAALMSCSPAHSSTIYLTAKQQYKQVS